MQKSILLITATILLLGVQSCYFAFNDGPCLEGFGPIVTEEFDFETITAITNETVIDIEIEQGDEQSVVVEGHENMIQEVYLNVINDELRIDLRDNCYKNFKLKVYITVEDLEALYLESTGDARLGDFEVDELAIHVSSTGDVKGTGELEIEKFLEIHSSSTGSTSLEVYTEDIFVDASSTGDITLSGSCSYQSIEMDGTADYKAFNLESEICDVHNSSTGDAKINVSDELNVTITSTGDVHYMGNPKIDYRNSGVGDLINEN